MDICGKKKAHNVINKLAMIAISLSGSDDPYIMRNLVHQRTPKCMF